MKVENRIGFIVSYKKMAVQYFENNVFSGKDWKSTIIQHPDELEKKFHALQLVGKTIVDAHFIGMDFDGTHMEEHPAIAIARQVAEIDEPIIFKLDDGRQIDIDYSEGSTFCIAENSIPLDVKSYQQRDAINGRLFFRNILGEKITKIVVNRTNEEPLFTGSYGWTLNEDETQEEFIDSVIFEMSNGFQIYMTSYIDFGHVIVGKFGQNRDFPKYRPDCWYVGDLKRRVTLSTPIIPMKSCKVLYADWEYQCCGKQVGIGSRVTWYGSKNIEDYFSEFSEQVDFQFRGHFCEDTLTQIKGVVKSITVIYRISDFVGQENTEKEGIDCYIIELKNVTVQDTGYRLY